MTVVAVGLMIGFGKIIFRGGLGFRVFAMLIPTIGLVGYGGLVLWVWLSSTPVFVGVALMTISASVISLTLVNRMVIKQYRSQIERLMASVARLSATAEQTSSVAAE